MRNDAIANGIVMIKMAQTTPARTYRIAIHQPQSTSQITLRISRIRSYYP